MGRRHQWTPPPDHIKDNESPFDKWLFASLDAYWIEPCREKLGEPLIGFCMYSPALGLGFLFVAFIALLSWCEKRANRRTRAKVD